MRGVDGGTRRAACASVEYPRVRRRSAQRVSHLRELVLHRPEFRTVFGNCDDAAWERILHVIRAEDAVSVKRPSCLCGGADDILACRRPILRPRIRRLDTLKRRRILWRFEAQWRAKEINHQSSLQLRELSLLDLERFEEGSTAAERKRFPWRDVFSEIVMI